MGSKIRIGIIGCGGIAESKHIPALLNSGMAEITVLCDKDKGRAAGLAGKFGLEHAAAVEHVEEVLGSDAEAVHICTANNTHGDLSIRAMEAGKDVLCEKPMASDAGTAEKMYEVSRKCNRKLWISYQFRFTDENLMLKKICESGDLGNLYYVRAVTIRRRGVPTWGAYLDAGIQGGGALIDGGTHTLDLALWLMQNYEVDYVSGAAFSAILPQEGQWNKWGAWHEASEGTEDLAVGFIRMKNGAVLTLESSWAVNMAESGSSKLVICGDKKGVDNYNGIRCNGVQYGMPYIQRFEACDPHLPPRGTAETPADREMKKWLAYLKGSEEPVILPRQALVVSQIIDAIYESQKTGRPVFF